MELRESLIMTIPGRGKRVNGTAKNINFKGIQVIWERKRKKDVQGVAEIDA